MKRESSQAKGIPMEGLRERVLVILDHLEAQLPSPSWKPNELPLDELVATILSQNTSDTNTERAFNSLRSRFSDWRAVRDAPVEQVIDSIRAGGLAAQKAPRIQSVLREVLRDDHQNANEWFVDRLRSMTPDEAMDYLTAMDGVGPKTAACVLLFAIGMPVVPVDTHVHRVAKRIGILGSTASATQAHRDLIEIVRPQDAYRFHVLLIHHGRTVCRARRPRCEQCILLENCDFGTRSRAVA